MRQKTLFQAPVELGGKSPNIYFEDVLKGDEGYIDKAIEGVVLGFFNQGEVCTCPSRVLVQESIYPQFVEKLLARMENIRKGDPFDTDTMIGCRPPRNSTTKSSLTLILP